MTLCDFHVHSDISQDSHASMYDMVCAEARCGVEKLCFTNHCDVVDWRSMAFRPQCRDVVPETLRQLEQLRARPLPNIEVYAGIELGEPLFAPQVAREIAGSQGLDFVIGSLHILQDYGDLYWIDYQSLEQCHQVFRAYLEELLRMAELDYFDVMAHIGYGRRYMWKKGFDAALSLDCYGEGIEELLRRLLDRGRGIELNCSGIRDGCGPFPQEEVLRLYRALGGEIITVGSDAHSPADAAKCLREGYDVLRACGFRYVTVFQNRQAEFIKL